MHDLEKENKLEDTVLLPGQSLNGIVAFRVNSLYNKSFLLKFNTMTVTSASFEKSIEALRIEGMAVMSNKTYIFKPQWDINFPGMNISNASVVRISFWGLYFASGRLSINNQDVILDDKLNIIVVRNYPSQFLI